MDRFSGILFDMNALNADPARNARRHINDHFTLANDRMIELADLISLRKVWIEIILSIKGRD